mmetsp:Transcript_4727/g.11125  ORF Transcript_4727/g.11125 Transcript_4727/m.11125 type:complete len:353 (-) Transcript_4727:453-1511(-)|eukprot:CAMPEP_0114506050 /NCGR_PEP_ID=MMETSP0109-20121206/11204_1 /TAXON_ID=29199 /ORGANISM="Chlorarachnion reptans, Strain CCCM449" /LENGTH=352 /DNA_ID=CAMNT_0001684579 /DNA_START=366 /DNA_END=1424 /DNA_ORIENTATION=-
MESKAETKVKPLDVFGKLEPSKVIRDVWAHNLKEEMERIMDLVEDYPYIAMDTEFPGIVARPVGPFRNSQECRYRLLKCNVDLLKIIQMGLCFCDDKGRLPPGGVCVWQFNFRFNLNEDMYARDSIEFLKKSGINFERHAKEGIDVMEFAEMLIASAIVLNDEVTWVTFHSGYDYGYLLRLLTCEKLPDGEEEFFDLLKTYCPCVYDVRYLMKSCHLKGGLSAVASILGVERCGPQHQAGSDSLLTQAVFFRLRDRYFDGKLDAKQHMNHLYGLGSGSSTSQATTNRTMTGAPIVTPLDSATATAQNPLLSDSKQNREGKRFGPTPIPQSAGMPTDASTGGTKRLEESKTAQ